jgi:hypothetical protein
MTASKKTKQELARISKSLSLSLHSTEPEEWQSVVEKIIRRIDDVIQLLEQAPVEMGKKGGQKTAERGPEYFRQIAAMRTIRAGGRPKNKPKVHSPKQSRKRHESHSGRVM